MKPLTSHTQIKDIHDCESNQSHEFLSTTATTIVSIQETESIVQSLNSFPIEEIGCSPFLRMYAYDVERLTLQAHVCAKRQDGDEYVVDAILSHGKLECLVRTLLAVEAWRLFVLDVDADIEVDANADAEGDADAGGTIDGISLPFIERIAKNQSSLRCAFILHVETTLTSLINLIVFRRENCNELASDSAISIALVDYCARRMVSAYCHVM